MTPQLPYEDKHFTKSFSFTLTANQELDNQAVELDKDADFFWESIEASYTGLPYGVMFQDSTAYQLSNDYIGSFALAAFQTGIGVPYTLYPSIWFPAGSSIILNLIELSGSTNGPIQLLFNGIKRFYITT